LKKVFIYNANSALYDQSESMAVRYMNRFAIEEDDQFEIASVQTAEYFDQDDRLYKLDKAMQAVVKLTNQIIEGWVYFQFKSSLRNYDSSYDLQENNSS